MPCAAQMGNDHATQLIATTSPLPQRGLWSKVRANEPRRLFHPMLPLHRARFERPLVEAPWVEMKHGRVFIGVSRGAILVGVTAVLYNQPKSTFAFYVRHANSKEDDVCT